MVEVFTTGETSGAVLHDRVQAVLQNISSDPQWLVGQCYDGAGKLGLVSQVCNEGLVV